VAGAGRVESGTDTIYAEASDAIVIPPGTPHRYYANEAKPWTIWWVHATGTDASDFGEAICGAGGGPVSIRIDRMLEAAALARAALTAMERDETKASLYDASAATWQLLSMLAARQLRGQHEKVDPIQAAADHIALHYSEPLQVAELAKRASLSVSHFASLFRRDFGVGPREYLCRIRMAHAREDLLTTADSVATVARSVGYDDPFYFSRQFSRIHGVPPSVYRRCQVRRTAVLLTGNRGTK
jgi:AraC-like DNA-binding protein